MSDLNHAEILAVRDAIDKGYEHSLTNAILYTTHEPCLTYSHVIRNCNIPVVVYGASIEHLGRVTPEFKILHTERVPMWKVKPLIISGILEDQCTELSLEYNNVVRLRNDNLNKLK